MIKAMTRIIAMLVIPVLAFTLAFFTILCLTEALLTTIINYSHRGCGNLERWVRKTLA